MAVLFIEGRFLMGSYHRPGFLLQLNRRSIQDLARIQSWG
jgi:hypothetical protein